MPTQLVAVASLLLGSAFLLIAGGLHGILLPVRGEQAGFTLTELGLLGTAWSAGFIGGCFLIPIIVRRVGTFAAYGALASVAAVTILLNALVITPKPGSSSAPSTASVSRAPRWSWKAG